MAIPPAMCFQIHRDDNVATLLEDAIVGSVRVVGQGDNNAIQLRESVQLGHKIALRDIPAGQALIKFGVPIGVASRLIQTGDWVHLHNCQSNFDQRSATLDLHSGAATDTPYS